jgi:hypothetical protein
MDGLIKALPLFFVDIFVLVFSCRLKGRRKKRGQDGDDFRYWADNKTPRKTPAAFDFGIEEQREGGERAALLCTITKGNSLILPVSPILP